jgi:hypothetical protein
MGDYLKFTEAVLKQVAKTFGVPAEIMHCDCTSYASVSVEITGYPTYHTEASRMIAALDSELPLLFDVRKAERLGDACVGELEGIR